MKKRVCTRDGCERVATHMVEVWLLPPAPMDGRMSAFLDMVLCPACAAEASMQSVFPRDELGWSRLCVAVCSMGKVEPSWERSSLRCVPIDECPDIFRNRYEPAGDGA